MRWSRELVARWSHLCAGHHKKKGLQRDCTWVLCDVRRGSRTSRCRVLERTCPRCRLAATDVEVALN